jgi:ribosome biogenesis SPOUT family RNA methylase Rps3
MQKPIIVIEHLEPELFKWAMFEYEQISKYVPHDHLLFTNVPIGKLEKFGKCNRKRIGELIDPKKAIILDPKADTILSPDDLEQFDYFIIGGILGDKAFNGRTGVELTKTLPGATLRHLGPKQFSTDNAAFVTMKILGGTPFDKIQFVDEVEIEFGDSESVTLPYRYPVVEGRPLMNPKLIEHLRDSEDF